MDPLKSDDNLLIFTTSPTGLGHLRVMDALIDGLPIGIRYEEIGIENIRANKIHALGSRIPILTKVTEFYQTNPIAEFIATIAIKNYIKSHSSEVVREFATLKAKYPDKKEYLVVSTHFNLAHAISFAKKELEEKLKIKIYLFVIVTDDSPQRIWAVKNADLIFTPSNSTRDKINNYLRKKTARTISYPVSPRLAQELPQEEVDIFMTSVSPANTIPLQIVVPISGAAVQIDYLYNVIKELSLSNFQFTVIGQETPYTQNFFQKISRVAHVQSSIGFSARQTVTLYESIFYQPIRPAIEITKPSEQAFKILLNPKDRGGVIELLTYPIGRQEYDNLKFFIRHRLIPNDEEQRILEKHLVTQDLPYSLRNEILYKASHWRGIRLPSNPNKASEFIKALKKVGILSAMMSFVAEEKEELTQHGVAQVWSAIGEYFSTLTNTE